MLLPENPKKRPGLWEAVATQLAANAMCFIVKNGVGNPMAKAEEVSPHEAELTLARLQEAQICRITANRGSAIAPHFAGKLEGDSVLVTELLTYPSEGVSMVDNEKLKRDIETAVINLLFAEAGVNTVHVPLSIAPWAMRDAEISLAQEGLTFSKLS